MLTLLESLSPATSVDPREDEILPVGSSHPIPQPSNALPVTYPPEARAEENPDSFESPQRRSIFKKWLQRKNDKDPVSYKLDRPSGTSRKPANRRLSSNLPPGVDVTNEGPSRMAAAQRRAVSAPPS